MPWVTKDRSYTPHTPLGECGGGGGGVKHKTHLISSEFMYTDVLFGSGVCTCQGAEYVQALFTYKRNKCNTFGTTMKLRLIFSWKAVSVHAKTKRFTKNSNILILRGNIFETANASNLPLAHTLYQHAVS